MTAKISCAADFIRASTAVALILMAVSVAFAMGTEPGAPIERISPKDAHRMQASGQALLVCAYGDDRCRTVLLEGALLRSQFEARVPELSRDQLIIFY